MVLELQPDFHNIEGSNAEAGYLRQKLAGDKYRIYIMSGFWGGFL